jgi:hypothetical protein
MGFDDYGASGGKRRSGVSATDGKGKGKVAGTEDDDGAKPAQHGAEVGARKRLAIRERGVDASLHPGAFFNDCGEEAELVGGSGDFSGEPWERKSCFEVGALGEFVAMRFETVCDTAEECAARQAGGLGVDGEGFGSEVGGAIELLQGCGAIDGLDGFAGAGSKGLETGAVARATFGADEGESGEFHVFFSVREHLAVSSKLRW